MLRMLRCDVCEVDFHSKEASDAHFLSEDHETAQVCSVSGLVHALGLKKRTKGG